MADKVDDAGLRRGLREGRIDRLGKPLQPVDHRNQDVLNAAVARFVHHGQPAVRAFVVGDPETEHLALPVARDPERKIDRLVLDDPAVLVPKLHTQPSSLAAYGRTA